MQVAEYRFYNNENTSASELHIEWRAWLIKRKE